MMIPLIFISISSEKNIRKFITSDSVILYNKVCYYDTVYPLHCQVISFDNGRYF